jgi:hypothetical protein
MEDRTRLVLMQAVLQNDTVRGFQLDQAQTRIPRSIAVSDVQTIEIRRVEAGLATAVGVAVVGGLLIAAASTIEVP